MKNKLHLLALMLFMFSLGFFWHSCQSAPLPVVVEESVAEDEEEPEEPEEEEEFLELELPPVDRSLPVSVFPEIWAYVVAGRETSLRRGMPITDIGYFAADVNIYGALVGVPNRRNLPAFSGRVHLVVKCDGRALSHFVLLPGRPEREALIAGLLAAARDYDGLQIDMENVPPLAGENFFTFLTELRAGLGNKMFTIALSARSRRLDNDVYDYEKIAPLVDRILVMAYDEHWSGSTPGSIASLAWCRRVATHSLNVIGRDKLIMGLPFYGRAWANRNHAQAYVYSSIERLINENNVTEIRRENGIPTFDYTIPVSMKVYYEDEYSLSTRMEMYRSMGVRAIGFWRLGQETLAVWNLLRIGN